MAEKKSENNEVPFAQEEHRDLISSLPLELGSAPVSLRLLQGTWIEERTFGRHQRPALLPPSPHRRPPRQLPQVRHHLAQSPRVRHRYSLDASHPLHTLNPHECIRFLDWEAADLDRLAEINAMDEPRLLSSHQPFFLLPHSVRSSSGCRLVYICRDPKDAVVSRWHFHWEIRIKAQVSSEAIPLSKFVDMFCKGVCPDGPIWGRALGYWKESLRAPEKVMFLEYEELLEDPVGKLLRLADFMGCGFTEEGVAARLPEQIVSLCSFENLSELGIKQNREISLSKHLKTESFYRKGVAGDWRNHLSPELDERLDQITREKLQATSLSFACFDS